MKKLLLVAALTTFLYTNSQVVYTAIAKPKPFTLKTDVTNTPENTLKPDFVYKDGLLKTVSFKNSEGEVVAMLKYYKEGLPLSISENLKATYPELKLFGVTELSTKERTTYEIVMESTKKWYKITSDAEGNFTSVQRFKKS